MKRGINKRQGILNTQKLENQFLAAPDSEARKQAVSKGGPAAAQAQACPHTALLS